MKLWEVDYEVEYERTRGLLRDTEYFLLENEDDPIEYIDKYYEKDSARSPYTVRRVGSPTLILMRARLDSTNICYLTKDGEEIE